MSPLRLSRSRIGWFVLGLIAAAPVHAGILAYDSFTLVPGPRDAGDPLVGTQTEVGGLTWVGHPSLPLGGDATNGYARQLSPHPYYAYVPVPDAATEPLLVLRADVRFSETGASLDEITIGFVNNVSNIITVNNGTNLALRRSGRWDVRYSGQGGQATGNPAPLFDPLGWNTLEFILDRTNPTQQRVTAKINGVTVLSNSLLIASQTINYAGFQFGSAPIGSAVDNFTLAIPEPGVAALLGSALICITIRRRRCP